MSWCSHLAAWYANAGYQFAVTNTAAVNDGVVGDLRRALHLVRNKRSRAGRGSIGGPMSEIGTPCFWELQLDQDVVTNTRSTLQEETRCER
jgi:hypothetical protein